MAQVAHGDHPRVCNVAAKLPWRQAPPPRRWRRGRADGRTGGGGRGAHALRGGGGGRGGAAGTLTRVGSGRPSPAATSASAPLSLGGAPVSWRNTSSSVGR